ncbi:MAG: Aspartyl/glutamyl-tRNA(Asn/Gln) amidotransferase subunit B [Chlamydiae bacterium]|nr:Aspartyl/glutamyl-tRNA(Asn/Gln) amidotransferase subunit B [Chlamydiota bacterium]
MAESNWEVIIGLEIHSELNTKTKLFSRAPNRFGDEPNTNITEVCTGMPGSLPVLNKEAVRKAVQFGCAINGEVAHFCKFDRKSYFYPDSPRNFQITQYDEPIVWGGEIIAEVHGEEMIFAVNRVHLEDDAGKLMHFGSFAGVDYNRAGVPLIEIVSEPCIHSADEAVAYAMAVKAILQYLDASDCNMEEGSLRFDVNVSIRPKGEEGLRNKIEIKNMNSFSFMHMAILSEIKRQIAEYEKHPDKDPQEVISQETYRWDPDKKQTVLMRRKEYSDDYRYFPEPDLVPIVLTEEYIEKIASELPELPLQRERRYIKELKLPPDSAFFLTSDKPLADYFEKALKSCPNARSLCNWLIVEFAGRLKESGKSIIDTGIPPQDLATLVNLIDDDTITGRIAKAVADDMLASPDKGPEAIIKENPDYQPMSDTGELEVMIDKVLLENQQSVEDYRNGKEKAFAFLVGQIMKMTRGKANPKIVTELLKAKIEKSS